MRKLIAILVVQSLLIWQTASAADANSAGSDDTHGLQPMVLVGIAAMLVAAKLGGEVFERLRQPAVLGELIAGIVLGNLIIFGVTAVEPLKTNEIIAALAKSASSSVVYKSARIRLKESWRLVVVSAGCSVGSGRSVLAGLGRLAYFLPTNLISPIFIGATLCATVLITAESSKTLASSRRARRALFLAQLY